MKPLRVPELRTERLVLRGYRMEDFEAYAAFYGSEHAAHIGGPFKVGDAWRRFSSDIGHWAMRQFGWWTVETEAGAKPIGFVGLHQPPHRDAPELGWVIYEGFEGHGYATEAARAARIWGNSRLGGGRIVSLIAPANTNSIRVAERLGANWDGSSIDVETGARIYTHPEAA